MRVRSWQQPLLAHSLDPLIDLLPCGGIASCESPLVVWFFQCRDTARADAIKDCLGRRLRRCEAARIVEAVPQRAERYPALINTLAKRERIGIRHHGTATVTATVKSSLGLAGPGNSGTL